MKNKTKRFLLEPLEYIITSLIFMIQLCIPFIFIMGGAVGITLLIVLYSWWYMLLLLPFMYIIFLVLDLWDKFTKGGIK